MQDTLPAQPPAPDDAASGLLFGFLRGRDVPCPDCGYNLRDLTDDVCPECRDKLRLTVGIPHVRFRWFIAAIMPGAAAGALGGMIGVLNVLIGTLGAGNAAPGASLITILGMLSGAVTLGIIWKRYAFVRLPQRTQRTAALVLWALHTVAFAGVVLLVLLT